MIHAAVVIDGVVVNVVDVESTDIPGLLHVPCNANVHVGFTWDGVSFAAPQRYKNLAHAKKTLREDLKNKWLQVKEAGVVMNNFTFPSDLNTLTELKTLLSWSTANANADVPVFEIDGSVRVIGKAVLNNCISSSETRYAACLSALQTKLAEVAALTDISDALNYDVNSGWPT